MKNIFLLTFFCFPFLSQSQESFFKNYDVWSSLPNGGPSGTFVLSDSSIITTFNRQGFFMMKTDKNGMHLWARVDSSNRSENAFYGNKIIRCRDGNFLLSGSRYSGGSGSRNSTVVKLDTAGNVIWHKTYINFFEPGLCINTTSDDGFILSGYTRDTIPWSAPFLSAIRADSLGKVIWCWKYITDSLIQNEKACVQTDDGGFLFISHSGSIKIDSAGNVLHANWFFTNTGWTENSKVIRINSNSFVYIAFQSNLCLYDSTGKLKWKLNADYKDVIRLSDSTFLLLRRGGWIWPGTLIEIMDTSGSIISGIQYELPYQIFPEKFSLMDDGRYVVSGLIDEYQLQYYQLFLMKTLQNGNLGCGENILIDQPNFIPDTLSPFVVNSFPLICSTLVDTIVSVLQLPISQDTLCYQITSTNESETNKNEIEIFPNPSSNQITISSTQAALLSLEIFNILGEKITVQTFSYSEIMHQSTVDVLSLHPGIYFLKVETERGTSVQKFIKQ